MDSIEHLIGLLIKQAKQLEEKLSHGHQDQKRIRFGSTSQRIRLSYFSPISIANIPSSCAKRWKIWPKIILKSVSRRNCTTNWPEDSTRSREIPLLSKNLGYECSHSRSSRSIDRSSVFRLKKTFFKATILKEDFDNLTTWIDCNALKNTWYFWIGSKRIKRHSRR